MNRRTTRAYTILQILIVLALTGTVFFVWSAFFKKPVAQKTARLEVKGLYMGMPLAQLQSIIPQTLGADWVLHKEGGVISIENLKLNGKYSVIQKKETGITLRFSDAGELDAILIPPACANLIFNSGDLTDDEFCQTFIDAYGIRAMDGIRGGWQHTTPENVRVTIFSDKKVFIEKVANRSQVQKSFN